VDQDTQQLDDNNPKSEATPEVTNGVASDTGQETPPEASAAAASAAPAANAPPEPVSSMSDDERKAALEAIIYAADEPATIEQLAKALSEPKAAVQVALDELVASYASDTRGIEIRGVAGGYKMYTKPQHHDLVRRFIKSLRPPLRLTMPALETLAVISYKQPVTAPEIQEIRGVNTSGVIKTLLDKKLITTAGRKEVIGRPILYRTSKEFLMRFGLSDLGELPSLKEFEALAREALGSDEGVAESDAGDESVLDSLEPTEAEAAAELEAAASEDVGDAEPGDAPTPKAEAAAAGADDSSSPKQYEQSISTDVVEAIASQPIEADSSEELQSKPMVDSAESIESPQSPETETVAEAIAQARETLSSDSESLDVVPGPIDAVAAPQDEPAANESAAAVSHPVEPEPVAAQSETSEPTFAEPHPEPAHAAAISMETPESPTATTEYESSMEPEGTEQEISDEILAQLASGIEIEVSAESLAALSSSDVPAEEAPTQFYSSDAEPEHRPLAKEGTEHDATTENDPATDREKSRGAAAGE
jgi:segregation and condensation protein B